MRKEIADRWIGALPKYNQGQKVLRSGNQFCCLGVLCDIAKKEGVVVECVSDANYSRYGVAGSDKEVWSPSYLPQAVVDWAGMQSRDGRFGEILDFGPNIGRCADLVGLNDAGASFNKIAKVIKERWETL